MQLREAGQVSPYPVLIPGLLTYEEYLRRQHSWDEVQRTTRLDGRLTLNSFSLATQMTLS